MFGFADQARSAAQHAAQLLYRAADVIATAPFVRESHPLPTPIRVASRGIDIDTVDDLVAFTGLDFSTVTRQLQHRRHINFRSEWLATPARLRSDHWFYLSSKAYLFANATHFPDDTFIQDFLLHHVSDESDVMEFGGGTGELALRLAASGIRTTFVELNALQREFVRFRVARHGLSDSLNVVAHGRALPADSFDAVIALDVIEHLPDARNILNHTLLPAMRGDGVFIENSPFGNDASNPMHHSDFGFDRFMHAHGFKVIAQHNNTRAWTR